MEERRRKILIILSAVVLLTLFIGFTYAWFNSNISGEGNDVTIVTETLSIVFTDTEELKLENAFPGDRASKRFTVENTGTGSAFYEVLWGNISNQFINAELVFTLEEESAGVLTLELPVPTGQNAMISNRFINPGEVHVYTLTIIFKETGSEQNSNQGKSFYANLRVEETPIEDEGSLELALNLDGEEVDKLPSGGYYKLENYTCENGTELEWNMIKNSLFIPKFSFKEECVLNYSTQNVTPLNTKSQGVYVNYVGTNGCAGNLCSGYNANYVSPTSLGYCNTNSYKYNSIGWRLAYVDGGSPYIIHAGGVECYNHYNIASTVSLEQLANVSLKYCNEHFVDGSCSSTNARSVNQTDFQKILGNYQALSGCMTTSTSCGSGNILINNGGYYFFATQRTTTDIYWWNPSGINIASSKATGNLYGIRPIIKLRNDVVIIEGSGTQADPYIIN